MVSYVNLGVEYEKNKKKLSEYHFPFKSYKFNLENNTQALFNSLANIKLLNLCFNLIKFIRKKNIFESVKTRIARLKLQ